MGVFTRARDIVNSNLNAALDKAENPEKLLKQMIREMEDTLIEIKAACAGAMAARKKAQRDHTTVASRSRHWESRARMAVDRGRDDLARKALSAKRHYLDEEEITENELDQLDEIVGQYKEDIILIEEKLGMAREKQRVLVQRHIHAQRKRRAQREIRRLDTSQAIVRFEEFQQRVDRAEAEAGLVNFGRPKHHTLEDEFRDIERDEQIERELEELKKARRSEPVAVTA